jgi:hypothetical protein
VRRFPKAEYQELKDLIQGVTIKRSTAYRSLKRHGITNWRAKQRPKLTRAHALLCPNWCKEHRRTPWKKAHFSDECSYERGSGKNRTWVFRTSLHAWDHDKIDEKKKGKDLTQMVWAAFSYNGRSELVIMERDPSASRSGYSCHSYMGALEECLVPLYEPGNIFQQDNAPIEVQEWLEKDGIGRWNGHLIHRTSIPSSTFGTT